jgi:hypothetical protein
MKGFEASSALLMVVLRGIALSEINPSYFHAAASSISY